MFYYAALLVPGTLSAILLPKVSRLNGLEKHGDAKKTLIKVLIFYTPIAIAGTLGTLLLARFVLSIIAPQYLPGILFFKVILSLGFLTGYPYIYTSYLVAKAKTKIAALVILFQNLILLIISFLIMKTIS
jgi:O-antigen/teichoic acid export membrane protein